MAELVDALVSNTSGSDAVPVRSRLRVLKRKKQIFGLFLFFAPVKHKFSEIFNPGLCFYNPCLSLFIFRVLALFYSVFWHYTVSH